MVTQYAVIFDFNTNCINECYDGSYYDAHNEVKEFMIDNGFSWEQGGVYLGDETMNSVKCVLFVQALAKKFPWFSTCVKDIRMLRIEENDDLLPAII